MNGCPRHHMVTEMGLTESIFKLSIENDLPRWGAL
jgi:hypothetical protein